MELIIIILLILLLGGGGGVYYGRGAGWGVPHFGGLLVLILVIILCVWLVNGGMLHGIYIR